MRFFIFYLVAAVLLGCGCRESGGRSVDGDAQVLDGEGRVCCSVHEMVFVEVDGYVSEEVLLVDQSEAFFKNGKKFPNHLNRFLCSLEKTETFGVRQRSGFCVRCEEGFCEAMGRKSVLFRGGE